MLDFWLKSAIIIVEKRGRYYEKKNYIRTMGRNWWSKLRT